MKRDGGGERARRFVLVDNEELGRRKADSGEEDGEGVGEYESDGGETVDLDGVQPVGERDRELGCSVELLEDRRLMMMVKSNMIRILSRIRYRVLRGEVIDQVIPDQSTGRL